MILPDKKVAASRVNPKKVILFGNPKVGKTTALSQLEDCLIIDVESGTNFVDALKIDVLGQAKEQKKLPIIILKDIINSIKKANEEKGGFVYRYIAIDTVSALEDVVLPLANKLYKNTAQGKNWDGDDVTLLGNGAGYRWTRLAMKMIISELEDVCDTLIILGHVKDKLVGKAGEEMTERGMSLTGQMPVILASIVDAVGYMYREDNRTVVSFIANESMVCGGRCPHLINKEVDLIVSDEEDNITVDWSEIFVD